MDDDTDSTYLLMILIAMMLRDFVPIVAEQKKELLMIYGRKLLAPDSYLLVPNAAEKKMIGVLT